MRSCLVTGGAGFIGCAISHVLLENYDNVIAIDNLHPQIHKDRKRPQNLNDKVELFLGDVTLSSDWDGLLQVFKPDTVIHLSAETGTGQSLTESYRHANVNVVGTSQMLDAFIRHQAIPEKLILTSSRAVYGEGQWRSLETNFSYYPGQRTREQLEQKQWGFKNSVYLPACASKTIPSPTSIYGATKLAQENIIKSWCLSSGVKCAVVRLQNVYGIGQSLINPYTGIVSLFVRMAKEKKSIPLYEDGLMIRDFVLIDDIAKAIKRVCQVMPDETLDIGTGCPNTISDMANIISAHYGAPAPHVCEKFRNGDVRHAFCEIEHTKNVLNWAPQFNLKQGLHILCDWIDEQIGKQNG